MKYLLILTLFAISCNIKPDENKEIELKPSNFMAPITDTIAVAQDSSAYIINNQ
jgi:hypothetical protein